MSVNKLDLKTRNQIAAGEVVENPSSVVKELVENALDAGATRIKILLRKGGTEEITVSDNGCGISAAEVRLALERHATSKITTIEDLSQVTTLGFRGEALPSIAAVSRILLKTRSKDEGVGSFIYLEGGEEKDFKETGLPPGTMVTVKDLFFNTPVRRKFLRSVAAESAQATRIIELLALSHPQISFTLKRDGKIQLETPGDGNILNTILQLFGHKLAPHLEPVQWHDGNYHLEGYVSSPSLSLRSRSHQIYFINNRYVRNYLLREALEQSYARFVTAKRYPLAFLFFKLPAEELDVNVHPAKTEVRFREKKYVFEFLREGITKTYQAKINTPVLETKDRVKEDEHNKTVTHEKAQILDFFYRDSQEDKRQIRETEPSFKANTATEKTEEDLHRDDKITISPLNAAARIILSQLFSSYILVQQGDNLLLVDQHAAHERILWEECLKRRKGKGKFMQEVLPFPQELNLPVSGNILSEERITQLSDVGLELEQFGNTSFVVRAVPFFVKDTFSAQMLADIFQDLCNDNIISEPDWQEAVLLKLTCKAAVKANTVLTVKEMESLLKQLEQCENPLYCPHGRPVTTKISKKELEKMFHRR